MTIVRFVVPGVPVAQPRQRVRVVYGPNGNAFASNYTPRTSPVNAFKTAVRLAAGMAHQGQPLAGPLRVSLTFVLPRPKSMTRKRGDNPRAWAPKKPDVDNLVKSTADALNGQLWGDDAQIVAATVRKMYAAANEPPCVEVEVAQLAELT